MKNEISVIIPSYNPNLDKLIECLKAINSSSLKPLDIILVDDGSTINYPEQIGTYCRVIKNKSKRGPACARNIGANEAKGNILCFIDTDIKIEETTLAKIAEKFCNPDIAAVQALYAKSTPVKTFLSQYQNLYQHYNFIRIRQKYLSTLSSFTIGIRKDLFFEAGGFPERLKNASVEDELLGIALYGKGYNILLAKDIKVEHMAYFNIKKLLKRMFVMGRDAVEYSSRYGKLKKIKFSKTHHHPRLIASILISPLILFLLMIIMLPISRVPAVLVVGSFLLLNMDFFIFIYKTKGILFMLKSIITYYFVCLSAFLGCIKGGINYLTK